jgi:hypothetical protein
LKAWRVKIRHEDVALDRQIRRAHCGGCGHCSTLMWRRLPGIEGEETKVRRTLKDLAKKGDMVRGYLSE